MTINTLKFFRYIWIYGLTRTIVKAIGRLNIYFPLWIFTYIKIPHNNKKNVAIIGCGQFSFSTITFFLSQSNKVSIKWCSDQSMEAARLLSKSYGIKKIYNKDEINYDNIDTVYIATNHSSHCEYAINSLEANCHVYVEKPLVTSWDQFERLKKAKEQVKKNIFVGYNRPFSPGIKKIRKLIEDYEQPFTLSCFISGHYLDKNHWYRNSDEGTRVCGNIGHWLDLAIHILFWRKSIVSYIDISISYSDINMPSDNISISLTTSNNDLINIVFSTRSEPFEGVGETINFQQDKLIAKIDDHRQITIWQEEKKSTYRKRVKNVGHKNAIMQPFTKKNRRQWEELNISTNLMLTVTDMVKNNSKFYKFHL